MLKKHKDRLIRLIFEDKKDLLEKNRSEVMSMILTTFNKKSHDKTLRREGFEYRLLMLVRKKFELGQSPEKIAEDLLESPKTVKKYIRQLQNKA